MSDDLKTCPQCQCPYGYSMGETQFSCPECGFDWNPADYVDQGLLVVDANGTRLHDGDAVTVIKDLPVKGAPKAIKAGTKVKNIRLKEGDHTIDCKIDGFGAMALKSEFVRKA